jgi:hypothetical protein
MISIVYSGPCVYDRNQVGMAHIEVKYEGRNPVITATRHILAIDPQARLYTVSMQGIMYYDADRGGNV